jgi:hypothetical protein
MFRVILRIDSDSYAKHHQPFGLCNGYAECFCDIKPINGVPGSGVNILGGPNIGHSKQKTVYVHVSYPERFPRYNYFSVQFQNC